MDRQEQERLLEFCMRVKNGFGTILDRDVKKEYERLYEKECTTTSLGHLLALLEAKNLLDKKRSVNKQPGFYQKMIKKL
jgi:hypothetical protein